MMSKGGPSMREPRLDYSIDCHVYPLGGGDSTDQTSQANLRTLNFTNTLYQLA